MRGPWRPASRRDPGCLDRYARPRPRSGSRLHADGEPVPGNAGALDGDSQPLSREGAALQRGRAAPLLRLVPLANVVASLDRDSVRLAADFVTVRTLAVTLWTRPQTVQALPEALSNPIARVQRHSVTLRNDSVRLRSLPEPLRGDAVRVPRHSRAVRRHAEPLRALSARLRDHHEPLPCHAEPLRCLSVVVQCRTEPVANRAASLRDPAVPLPSRREALRRDPEALPQDSQPLRQDRKALQRESQALRRSKPEVADRIGGERQPAKSLPKPAATVRNGSRRIPEELRDGAALSAWPLQRVASIPRFRATVPPWRM